MPTNIERLLDVAKRLDEIADDGPSELTTLSDEIGKIVASIEDAPPPNTVVQSRPVPRWMRDMQQMIERAAEEIIFDKYDNQGRHEIVIRNPRYGPRDYRGQDRLDAQMMAMLSASTIDPQATFKKHFPNIV
jgi:hypothetical protein